MAFAAPTVGASAVARALAFASRPDLTDTELLALNQGLLAAIAEGDWESYCAICDPQLSCFEPEAKGHLVTGLGFHEYYFQCYAAQRGVDCEPGPRTTVVAPYVRWLCGRRAAVVCFKRLVQRGANTVATEETRIWEFSVLGAIIEFKRGGQEYVATIVSGQPVAPNVPAGMTHQLEYSLGGSGTEWVRLDEVRQLLHDQHGRTDVPYTVKASGRWRLVHFHRSGG